MRALLQRVSSAQVSVGDEVVGECARGFVILLGVGRGDDATCAERLWRKVVRLRVFEDGDGKANLSLADIGGEVLVVSQFTLYASCRKGNRPSFTEAARPELARELYERFCQLAAADVAHVGRGIFGAHMRVSLENDGPFTIWLDTDELARPRHAAAADTP